MPLVYPAKKEKILRIPIERPRNFVLRKRISPRDYFDGFIGGLETAKYAIDKSISTAKISRRLLDAGSDPGLHN